MQRLFLGEARFGRKDQRGSRLVDQHAVGLVDDRELKTAQQQPPAESGAAECVRFHGDRARPAAEHLPVAQVVERDLLVAAVGDVAAVCRAARIGIHALLDTSDRQAERLVDRPHPIGIALGQIVVHGDHVDRATSERRGGGRERRGERLAFPGFHLREHAVQHRPAAGQLHVEMSQPDGPSGGFAHQRQGPAGERQVVEAGAPQLRTQLRRVIEKLRLGQIADAGCRPSGRGNDALEPALADAHPAGKITQRRDKARELALAQLAALWVGRADEGRCGGARHQTANCLRNTCRTARYSRQAIGSGGCSKRA
jgi:hypothetical protein